MLPGMTEPQQPPPVSPYLTVADAKAAVEFYVRAFGAKETQRHATPDGKKLMHVSLEINGGLVMLCDDFPEMQDGKRRDPNALGGTSVTLHLDLPDVDATFARAVEAGAVVTMPLQDQFWGDRYGKLRDPFGHEWSLATRKRAPTRADIERGAQEHFGAKHGKS
jgi:PhnB protein